MNAPIQAWYFSDESRRLRYGDDREIAIGVTHEVAPPIKLCERGLHASVRAMDALQYAPGPVIWRVALTGEVLAGDNKHVATQRTYIAGGIDVSAVLRRFARECAKDVLHLWNAPQVVIDYLNTGDESIRAAARDAARAAARDAARDAARAAARAAAWDAAWDAAGDAAWAAAWDAQNARLESMLLEAIA